MLYPMEEAKHMDTDETLARALAWINEHRAEIGLPPLPAWPKNKVDPNRARCQTCPVAVALGDSYTVVDDMNLTYGPDYDGAKTIHTPASVGFAVRHFDRELRR